MLLRKTHLLVFSPDHRNKIFTQKNLLLVVDADAGEVLEQRRIAFIQLYGDKAKDWKFYTPDKRDEFKKQAMKKIKDPSCRFLCYYYPSESDPHSQFKWWVQGTSGEKTHRQFTSIVPLTKASVKFLSEGKECNSMNAFPRPQASNTMVNFCVILGLRILHPLPYIGCNVEKAGMLA